MRRRDFITAMGSVVAMPAVAHVRHTERIRRVAIILPATIDDAPFQLRITAFHEGLHQAGWTVGRNVHVDTRWASAEASAIRKHATKLVARAPDVIVAFGASTVSILLDATRTIPIVFLGVGNPVGGRFVESLSRPGGNATGFTAFDDSMGGKWLEMLKEVAPTSSRAAVLLDPSTPSGSARFGAIQTAASLLRTEVFPVDIRDASEIARAVATFAHSPNGGLIATTGGAWAARHRRLIIATAARHTLPAVYFDRSFPTAGGLMSYGPNFVEQFRQAGSYVGGILNGEKTGDLPVQGPTKLETVINLKTAKSQGFSVSPSLLARADEVIESTTF